MVPTEVGVKSLICSLFRSAAYAGYKMRKREEEGRGGGEWEKEVGKRVRGHTTLTAVAAES